MRHLLLFFFSHRTLALLRWDIHFMSVRFGNFLFNRGRVINKFFVYGGKKYLNLGSGPRGIVSREWLNIDGFPDRAVQFYCDFSRPIPIPDEKLDGIFTEHVIEHFTYQGGKAVLTDCYRMLKPGGVIRIIVPDGRKILRSYFDDPQKIIEYKDAHSAQPMEAVNAWFYQRYEHQCIYDSPYLIQLLKGIGYSVVSEATFRETVFDLRDIVIDDEKYAWESLIVEAKK
jgi:predicted SAM-dependent methyltransferase